MLVLLVTLFLTPLPPAGDTTALVRETARLTVRWHAGAATILHVERRTLASPARFPRWRGRFEARALAADKPIELVRFDFPLMAEAEAPDDATAAAKRLGKKLRDGVTATTYVELPLPAHASAVAIYDTFTKKQVVAKLPPAAAPAAGAAGSAGR
jgi:hypothetical protein